MTMRFDRHDLDVRFLVADFGRIPKFPAAWHAALQIRILQLFILIRQNFDYLYIRLLAFALAGGHTQNGTPEATAR